MNVYFPKSATNKLQAKLDFVKGKGSQKLVEAIAGEIAEGNDYDRLQGLDRYGRPQAPVKKREGKYKGATGPPLAPFGAASRVVANFRSQRFGRAGSYRIVAGWENVVSKSGVPFLPFHDKGVKRSGGKAARPRAGSGFIGRVFHKLKVGLGGGWFLPPRPIFGISPRTWKRINARIDEFKAKVRKVK